MVTPTNGPFVDTKGDGGGNPVGLTPKGQRIPQTIEEFAYLADLYEQAMLKQFNENGKLRHKINTLEQRIENQAKNMASYILENPDET